MATTTLPMMTTAWTNATMINSTIMINATTTAAAPTRGPCRSVPGGEVPSVTVPPAIMAQISASLFSYDWDPIPTEEKTLKILFYIIIFLLDVVGNGLVIFIVVASRKMRTPTNILLVNLAMADLLVALLCMWVHLGQGITNDWPFGLGICKANMFAQVTVITTSVLTLTVISIERFVAIVFPLKGGFTVRMTGIICVIIWVIAFGIASPQLHIRVLEEFVFKDRHVIKCAEDWPVMYKDEHCTRWKPTKIIYHTFVGVTMYLVPIIVMIICYTIVCVSLLTRKAPGTSRSSAAADHQNKVKRRVIRMLVILVVVFVICWTPTHVVETINLYDQDADVSKKVTYLTLFVAYCNSALNPILYAGFNENFRRGFKDIFKCNRPLVSKSSRILPDGSRAERSQAPNKSNRVRNGGTDSSMAAENYHPQQLQPPNPHQQQNNHQDNHQQQQQQQQLNHFQTEQPTNSRNQNGIHIVGSTCETNFETMVCPVENPNVSYT